MPRRPDPRTDPGTDHDCTASLPALTASRLTPEQVRRWAELIADGRDRFPADLQPPDREGLLAAVLRRRRDRLVQYIARAIASALRGAEHLE
jgi:hypothetical protein